METQAPKQIIKCNPVGPHLHWDGPFKVELPRISKSHLGSVSWKREGISKATEEKRVVYVGESSVLQQESTGKNQREG